MSLDKTKLISKCKVLLQAYKKGLLGYCVMPEASNPGFDNSQKEEMLVYFTLPMSLNYQRDSYKLWEAVLKTYQDPETHDTFSIKSSATMSEKQLKNKLLKHKLALLPNKHVQTWLNISKTIYQNFGTMENLFKSINYDFLKLKDLIQIKYKKCFPYLSGSKIFNYWSFIISTYGKINLKNRQFIEIAPDTHIIKCSVLLEVITEEESKKLNREQISKRWRELLDGSGIKPIEMHPPLWFWSRNNFQFKL